MRIHPSAEVSEDAQIGDGTSIWHHAQIREGAQIGRNCIIGKGVYVGAGVQIGNHVKIQNYVSVFSGVTLEDGVFVGPHVCFTNDIRPRAVNPDMSPKSTGSWRLTLTQICQGAALGANSTVVCGTTIGKWAMVGSGSVVTQSVPDYGLVWGNPARLHGFVCPCGASLGRVAQIEQKVVTECPMCNKQVEISVADWERVN
jgi:UDP-2-acetamido-3-amino-2,3-dideoxy-glucuronate N-acetyltransferase